MIDEKTAFAKAVDLAIDTTKLIITLSTTIITLSVTVLKLVNHQYSVRWVK